MSRRGDPSRLLADAIVASGPAIRICSRGSQDWASVTFAGARHQLTIEAPASERFDAWLDGLTEADLPLRGHLVADVAVVAVARIGNAVRVDLEALTVVDA